MIRIYHDKMKIDRKFASICIYMYRYIDNEQVVRYLDICYNNVYDLEQSR